MNTLDRIQRIQDSVNLARGQLTNHNDHIASLTLKLQMLQEQASLLVDKTMGS